MRMRLIFTPKLIRLQLIISDLMFGSQKQYTYTQWSLWKLGGNFEHEIVFCFFVDSNQSWPSIFLGSVDMFGSKKAICLQCSLWKLGGNSEREHVFCLLWTAIKVCRKICSQCLQRCHRRTGGGKFETFLNKVILLKVYTHANGFRNIIWILLKRPLFHQYE